MRVLIINKFLYPNGGCVQTVIKNYDFSKLPVKQKLFCQAIYNKNNLLTYALAALQNWKKKRELFH